MLPSGFKYGDKNRTPDGVSSLKLGGGTLGRLGLKGRSGSLPPFPLPLASPVTVQLQASNGECWESVFPSAQTNDGSRFQAKN